MKSRFIRKRFAFLLALGALVACATLTTLAPGQHVSETTVYQGLKIADGTELTAPEGSLLTMVVNGVEKAIVPGAYRGKVALVLTEDYSDAPLGSYNGRGGEKFRAGLYVDGTGLVAGRSVEEAVTGGSYDGTSAKGISIKGESDNFNGIIVNGAEYTISDAKIKLTGNADGSDTSDFSGLGSVIAAYNDAKVTIKDSDIYSQGVARPVLFTDSGSDTLVEDSRIASMGGTLYKGYVNTADQAKMVAPPWVLGITGNARTTNLMGTCSTTTVVRTEAFANQWGVLSTDSGSDMVLTAVDSTLTLLGEGQKDPMSEKWGSGYGTYIIGDAREYFYGCTFNVGTYASILTGGKAVYASSKFDKPLDVYPLIQVPNGTTVKDFMGNEKPGYDVRQADKPVFTGITGQGKVTTINSDAFGFMAHNSGSLVVTDGTVVNTDNATFLLKSGSVDVEVSGGAKINTEDGIILQVIDNDDTLVGADFSHGAPNFFTDFFEEQGYPGIDYPVKAVTERRDTYNFAASDVALKGNLYNGSGYFGGMAGDVLNVTLGSGASLEGDISASSVMHVNEKGEQNKHFTVNEYYYLGHVSNRVFYNGANDVNVTLKAGSSWTVADSCLLTGLTIDGSAALKAPAGKVLSLTVNGVATKIAPGSYKGKISLTVAKGAIANLAKSAVISATTAYPDGLAIADGVTLTAPAGSELTLTVDGVEKNLVPGVYAGNAVISVTGEYIVTFMAGAPFEAKHHYRMGLYVKDGTVVPGMSATAALQGVAYNDTSAKGGLIEAEGDVFNGIVVGGNSTYSIDGLKLRYSGNGGNDFAGYGAGITSTDESNVTLSNLDLRTNGVISPAVIGMGNSTLVVKDSAIVSGSEKSNEGVKAPFLKEVPWVLGISGNTRATNVLGSAKVTYENCYVEAKAWGALSTDQCLPGSSLTAINTKVVVKDSGYGAYADISVFDTFTGCTFDVPDFGFIVASGNCGGLFNGGTVVNSKRFGVLWHKNQEGTVTLEPGTVFNTGETVFLVKSDVPNTAYPNLVVDGAKLNAANGVILHLMESDDAGMGGGMPGTADMWAKEYVIPTVKPVVDGNDTADPQAKTAVKALFRNMDLKGDIYNSRWTAGQNLTITLESVKASGVFTAGVQSHKTLKPGDKITPANRELLSEASVSPHEAYGNGLLVSLDGASSWEVAATSYLTYLKLADGAKLTAPAGKTLTLLVNGKETPVAAGTYAGKITLAVK